MKDTDNLYCRILLDVLREHGVKDIVASPGTRNAPLLISCSYREEFKTQVISDERNAAFVALGLSVVSKRPVAILCTSGTALYNYAPAVAEAYYQGVPLIVITADRPSHWIDQNDSQTLIQPGALEKIVKKSFDIPLLSQSKDMEWSINRLANEAMLLASDGRPGPVHINIQFEAPLSRTLERDDESPRIVRKINPVPYFSRHVLDQLTSRLEGKRILVVAGFMQPNADLNKYLGQFSTLPGVKLLCETISNLHLPDNPYAVDTILAGLDDSEKRELAPDIVISIGGALISGMLKDFLRTYSKEVWTLGDTYFGIDTFKSLSLNIEVAPAFFFKALFHTLSARYKKSPELKALPGSYIHKWNEARERQLSIRKKFVEECEWSELKIFSRILPSIPSDFNLFLSNGTSVRYGQLFTENIPHAVYSNRGVSGIDGTTATAAGCSMAYKGRTLLITGDMSFAYAPGVLGLEGLPADFKIIVFNNKGGGIFRFISPTRYIEHRDRYLCADPKVPVKGLAEAYGWEYILADSEESLDSSLDHFFSSDERIIMEVRADEEYSASILRKYMRLNGLNE